MKRKMMDTSQPLRRSVGNSAIGLVDTYPPGPRVASE